MSARMNSTSIQQSVDASVTAGFSSKYGLQETWVQTDLSLHTRDLDLLELIYLLKTSNILELRPVTGECPLCGYVKAPCKDGVPGYSKLKNGRQNLIEGFSNKPILNNGNNECWKQIQTMSKETERVQLKTADLRKRRPEKEIPPADHHSARENDSLTTDDNLSNQNTVSTHSPRLASLNKRKSEDVKTKMHNHPNVKHQCNQNLSKTLPVDSNKDVHISTASSDHVRSRSQQHAVFPSTEASYAPSSGHYYSDSHHFVHNAGIYSAVSFEDSNTNLLTWHKDRTLNSEETSCMPIGSHLASDDSSFQFLQYSPLNTDRVPMVSSGFYDNQKSLFPRSTSQHEIFSRQNARSNELIYQETNTKISKLEDSKK
ncbi:uncharacterized protein LOC106166324 [Lingula anatina]|uniref:Uncharacterized protein LOC106166324 n=1 Tax=Lingula anatina TaxID=7574 RepID=A0A1S3IQW2_LINAN|nr:uncharacterized protein LOC106166324 [Lingula anatina]|eukprot:XP_013400306.1 uncharacterized protein LOC106166324 [Lingula anatina]